MSEEVSRMTTSLEEKLDKAFALFKQDHVAAAYPLFRELATEGNPRALYFMGRCHCNGWGVLSINEELGLQYYHLGAEKGDVLCQLNLAYHEGNAEAVRGMFPALRSLAQEGDLAAQDEFGWALAITASDLNHSKDAVSGDGDAVKEGEHWMQMAAEAGYWPSILCLTRFYGDVGDLDKMIQWRKTLIQMRGDHAASSINALCWHYRRTHKQDYDKQFQEIVKWADEGYGWAVYHAAYCYEQGRGVQKNLEKAIELYRKAYGCYDREVAGEAAFCLAGLYEIQNQLENAFIWYEKGAKEGHSASLFYLARCYDEGSGVPHDREKAIELYREVIDRHGYEEEEAEECLEELLGKTEEK